MRPTMGTGRNQRESTWPKSLLKKWLNLNSKVSDFTADETDNLSDSDKDVDEDEEEEEEHESNFCKLKRRNSVTLRAQYIDAKDVRICIGTWNFGGKVPDDDLDIEEWIYTKEPADIYVLGIQEIVPLNASNIFGSEDRSPVPIWVNLVRDSLNKVRTTKPRYKCYSVPPSPSKFQPPDGTPAIVDDLLHEIHCDSDNEKCILFGDVQDILEDFRHDEAFNCPSMKKLGSCRSYSLKDRAAIPETPSTHLKILTKSLSRSERIGLAWPEQSLDLLAKCSLDSPNSVMKSFKTCSSFKSSFGSQNEPFGSISRFDLDAALHRKRRPSFVMIISKQMVGIFVTIWVRRSLRKHIQNVKVSTVGVGAMGYIGNKGSISVSMSIYQTTFCFVCVHLSSGETNGDKLRRNVDAQEIHRRTRFMGLLSSIKNHERIFWFGDLNYRFNLTYKRVHELVSSKKWLELFDKDQLKQELRKGGTFDGWKEGIIDFPPSYKYEFNSDNYVEVDSKGGKRSPAWCDRILSFGNGIRLLSYQRSELMVSDHRPVTATYLAEVEVISHRKLQKALALTEAEIDEGNIIEDTNVAVS